MKISRKKTITDMGAGGLVQQTAWTVLTKELIQVEFSVEYPPQSGHTGIFGALGIFLSNQIERVRFLLHPSDIFRPNHPAYEEKELNFLEFSGILASSERNIGYGHSLALRPTFDKHSGWEFEFSEAIARFSVMPHKYDHEVTAEKVVADIVCSGSFKVDVGRGYVDALETSIKELYASIILQDIEGLRLVISDVLGKDYLAKLLRMNGYVVDADTAN